MQEPKFERSVPLCQEIQLQIPPYGNPKSDSMSTSRPIGNRSRIKWLLPLSALWRTLKRSSQGFLKLVLSIPFLKKLQTQGKSKVNEMIGSIEKGMVAAQVVTPPKGSYDGVDLKVLPKYISFRAALLRTQLTQQYVILILALLLIAHFAATRIEIFSLYGKLRAKEYILAPGVQDFTPASAQSVPDSYVADAVTEYLGQLGNITSGSIDEQYKLLAGSMSPQLQVKFLSEAADFKAKVKSENISELLTVAEKEIKATGDGYYQVTALAKRDTYVNNEYIGHVEEAIEMVLQLVPPKSGRRWFLQIDSLTRQSAETFKVKRKF